jgi:hypothetical protein
MKTLEEKMFFYLLKLFNSILKSNVNAIKEKSNDYSARKIKLNFEKVITV